MQWVTRERPKIDRIACPWLIARFVDQAPEFLFVPPSQVIAVAHATGAVPFDVPDVELGHDGDLCSFDAFLRKYALNDSALADLALIVRGAGTARLDLAPQSTTRFISPVAISLPRPLNTERQQWVTSMLARRSAGTSPAPPTYSMPSN